MERAGFIALIGEPNAGKSTLLNQMVGAKVSIVTHKVQTTRARIGGLQSKVRRNLSLSTHQVCSSPAGDWIAQWLQQLGAVRQTPI